ncbi:Hypothetical protein PHPALM_8084 [Phytophthora palmivora]|uniref:Uncharacterized protein n=1 Tax=Phytophthora palmivora TaxID=4796 RepID=A0A2P4YAN9_9STRA|nr:Hypothetical protein PHPALM_8084 [Phytophthora palmivora]
MKARSGRPGSRHFSESIDYYYYYELQQQSGPSRDQFPCNGDDRFGDHAFVGPKKRKKRLEYMYSIEHIEGVLNVWTDLISRWGGKPLPTAKIHSTKRVIRHKRKCSDAGKTIGDSSNMVTPLRPLDQDGFV